MISLPIDGSRDTYCWAQSPDNTMNCKLPPWHRTPHRSGDIQWSDIYKIELPDGHKRRANDTQVGGDHYELGDFQVWDAWWHWNLNPFQAVVLKYVVRYRNKGGVEDLRKAIHYIEKLIELEEHEKDLHSQPVAEPKKTT